MITLLGGIITVIFWALFSLLILDVGFGQFIIFNWIKSTLNKKQSKKELLSNKQCFEKHAECKDFGCRYQRQVPGCKRNSCVLAERASKGIGGCAPVVKEEKIDFSKIPIFDVSKDKEK